MDLLDVDQELNEVREIEIGAIPRRNPKVYLERRNPFEIYDNMLFKRKYRVNKEVARTVINLVRNDIANYNSYRGLPISPEIQVLATIRYLAKGAYGDDMSEIHGLSQPVLSIIVKRVVVAIARHRPEYIKFPEHEQISRVKRDFYNIAHCPSVVGCIDGTHIKIKCPSVENPHIYLNRKNFYSLNTQVVCDAKGKIIDIVARWRGSAHDSRIWNECSLRRKFMNGEVNGILLGDNGYPCSRHLITPLLHPVTEAEQRFNRSHIRTRNLIERVFGRWKNMFRCFFNGLQIKLETTKAAIVATAIIYNISLSERIEEESDDENEVDIEVAIIEDNFQGNLFRRQYIQRYFN